MSEIERVSAMKGAQTAYQCEICGRVFFVSVDEYKTPTHCPYTGEHGPKTD